MMRGTRSTIVRLGAAALGIALLAAGAGEAQAPIPPAGPVNAVNGASASTERGFGIFQQKCMSCHGSPAVPLAPSPEALRAMTPEHIYDVLTNGVMYPVIGNTLSDADRKLTAEMIAGHLMGAGASGSAEAMPNRCPSTPSMADPALGSRWNGWGHDIRNSRFQANPGARLNAATVKDLKLKWAFGVPGSSSMYSQPTIVAGRVFIGSDTGEIYALDARTGCVHWSYQAKAGVRNALTVGPVTGHPGVRYGLYFGDLKDNVYALDAQTGRPLWSVDVETNYSDRVTAAPQLEAGVLYVPVSSFEEFAVKDPHLSCCTSVGKVVAVNASTGKILWGTYVIPERPRPTRKNSLGVQQYAPAGGSVWNTPAIDLKLHRIYFGTGDATTEPAAPTSDAILSFDMRTGKPLWSYQAQADDAYLVGCNGAGVTENCPAMEGPDWDIPTSVILTTTRTGHRLAIAGTKPGDVIALDPDRNGKLVWRMNVSGALAAPPAAGPNGPRYSGMMWGGAVDQDNVYYGLTRGGVAAIRLADGKLVWRRPSTAEPGKVVSNATPMTEIPGALFVGGSDGRVMALSPKTGTELWGFDTARTFDTVDKVPAKGGAMSSQGVTVANDMLFVGSGYAVLGAVQPGNVLLAFGLD